MSLASKRAKMQVIPNNTNERTSASHSSLFCEHCTLSTNVTLDELVRRAYIKNQSMRLAAEPPLHRVVRQRALWTSLRQTFFAPGVDSDALSEAPALTHHERMAYPCHCRRNSAPCSTTMAASRMMEPRSQATASHSRLSSLYLSQAHPESKLVARNLNSTHDVTTATDV
eukprot:m.194146 g.194146  ORF g.194146 m.194146 type:complete len:170 (+) comp16993_c0_seq20:2287-2796(+)